MSAATLRAALGAIGGPVKTHAASIIQLAAYELATVFGLEMKELREGEKDDNDINLPPFGVLRIGIYLWLL